MIEQTSNLRSDFPNITYRRGSSGQSAPILCGTGARVQTIVTATQHWELTPSQIAVEYGLSQEQVHDALVFYRAHRAEIDAAIVAEQCLAQESNP